MAGRKTEGIFEPIARSHERPGYIRCWRMDQEVDQIIDLETLESLLGDIERAMAEDGSIDGQRMMEIEQLRELCAIKKKELMGSKG
jgi:hypothetical protein